MGELEKSQLLALLRVVLTIVDVRGVNQWVEYVSHFQSLSSYLVVSHVADVL